jgi:hypothetical protein
MAAREKQTAEIHLDLGSEAVRRLGVWSGNDTSHERGEMPVRLIDEIGVAEELLQSSERMFVGRASASGGFESRVDVIDAARGLELSVLSLQRGDECLGERGRQERPPEPVEDASLDPLTLDGDAVAAGVLARFAASVAILTYSAVGPATGGTDQEAREKIPGAVRGARGCPSSGSSPPGGRAALAPRPRDPPARSATRVSPSRPPRPA